MSHVHEGPLATYNSLTDPNLAGYFGNTRMRRHLKKSGLVNRRGEIISENQYRLNMARREHKKHVKDLLAQAIVHKTLDLERYRQVEIKKKLEEIAKIELVRRVRATRGRKGDEDVLPYLSPRSHSRPQSGKPSEASSGHRRPKSAPAPPRNRQHTSKSGYTDPYDDVIYVNEDGRPVSPPPPSDRHSYNSSLRDVRNENIDTRHLYALDSEALQQYALKLSKADRGRDGASSPYLLSQIPQPPRRERAKSAKSPRRSGRMSARPDSSRRQGVSGNLMLHRQEPAMMHQGEVQTLCEITMKYHGPNLTLPRDQFDPTQEVHIEQQHCGGNTLPVFKERLQAGSTFSFISRRHRGYPFSLTLYIDGRVDCRVSTCCEYKHGIGVKLGGKMGHFSLTGITGATPCYKCKLSVQAPPRSLKLKKGYRKKKTTQTTDEVVTVEGTPRKAITPTTQKEEQSDDNYDDDFEEEDSKDNKYEDDFEEEEEQKSDRRHIIGLREDENRINGKTVTNDVVEKEKEEEKQGVVPANRDVEGYSSEDEDADGPRSKSIEVTADIHAQKKDESPKKRRRSLSSSSSSSSSSSDREITPRPKSPERKTRSPEPVKTAVVEVHTARSEETVPPKSDRSDRSTTSGSLTTETESTLESNRRQELVKPKERRSSSSSSSSTLSSDSEDEKYQRKKRDERQRQENEKRRKEEEERRQKEAEEREIERKKKFEEDERRRAEEEEERKKRFELQRQQSQDRLRLMEEQRKKQESERQQKLAEQNQAKEEERKRRLAEEERMQKDYEKQMSFIQSQRESSSTLSVETTPRETKSETEPAKFEKRRESSSSSSSSESESEIEKEKSPFSKAVASLKSEEAEEKKTRESSSSSSTDTSSMSGSDTEKEKQMSQLQPMKTISEEEKAKDARRESTSSASSSSSSSSGGEHVINKDAEPEQKEETKAVETPVVKNSPETSKEPEKRRASSVSSESSSGSSSESDEDNKKVTETIENVEEKEVVPQKVDTVQEKPTSDVKDEPKVEAKIERKSSSSSSSSSEYLRSESRSDREYRNITPDLPPPSDEKKIEVVAKIERKSSSSSLSSSYSLSQASSDDEFKPAEKSETPAPFGGIQHEETIIPEKEIVKPETSTSPPKEEKTEVAEKKNVADESEDSSSDSSSSESDSESDNEDEKDKTKEKKDSKPSTSESEAENMHGGNDPENVAQSGTLSESQLVKAVVRQPMTHYGSILPMVKGSISIDLNGVKLDDSQVTEITNYLAEADHVKNVTLRNCGLNDVSFQNVALSLQVTHSSPQLLNFSKNELGAKSLQPLSVAIKNKPSVEIVILNGNPVGNVGCKVLIDALVKTKDPFPFLRRGSGYLTPSEARNQESEGKQVDLEDPANDTGCNIKDLDLGDCKIGDAGIAEISRFLESNKTLVSLNLNGNREISPSGWERLGQALKKNKTLQTLSLDFTDIGDSGIDNLAKGLKVNTGLRSLELESANLTEKGGQILRDLLKSNTSIIELTVVPGNDISDGTVEEIRKYIAMNNTAST